MPMRYIHAYIAGKVQGVWFRAHTQKKARELNITGWVKNLEDGRVEVFAAGDFDKVKQLEEWLWHGPSRAEVMDVAIEEVSEKTYENFEVL